MFHDVLLVVHDVLHVFHDVLQCCMMLSESRNDRRRRIGARAAVDRLRDRDNSAKIGDGAAGIVDIAANVFPC